jgi:hypothetical protein
MLQNERVEDIAEILAAMKIHYPKSNGRSTFTLCEHRCRHSSASVVHSKEFRSAWKHCYGKKKSPLIITS